MVALGAPVKAFRSVGLALEICKIGHKGCCNDPPGPYHLHFRINLRACLILGHEIALQPETTVILALAELPSCVAVMVAIPGATPLATPPLLTVATDGFDELQAAWVVIVWVPPSEYVPTAVNCWMDPISMPGVTDMEDSVAAVTDMAVLADILPEVAETVAAPAATPVARPLLLTVAIDVFNEVQVTCVVISWVVPSEYVPVAISCWATPTGRFGLAGVTAREDRVAVVTVRGVLADTPPETVEMVAVPSATAVARPLPLIVATDVFDELQVSCAAGITWLVPSEYVPTALNWGVSPTGMLGLAGVIVMENRVAAFTARA